MRDEAFDRRLQRIYRLTFEHSRDAMIVLDDDGRVLLQNLAARDLPEGTVEQLFEASGPHESLLRFGDDLRVRGRATAEVRLDGRTIAVNGSAQGGERVVVLRDVSDERRRDGELRARERAESMGHLTASIVHDFNNLLTPIACLSARLEQDLRETSAGAVSDMASDIRTAASRAAELARRMLTFGRSSGAHPQRVSVGAAVAEVRDLLERIAGANVEVEVVLEASTGDAMLDRERLDHTLLHLTTNARDAMTAGGRVTIRTANIAFEENGAEAPDGATMGSYVALTVTDTGGGMTSEARNRIFTDVSAPEAKDPVTKEFARPAGLGLTAVRRFVAESGGMIAVHSEANRGTTVALYFPRVDSQARTPAVSMVAPESKRGSETVLVVDTDAAVRGAVRAVLEHHGYHVLDAASGNQALEVAQTSDGPIDLVIAEVIMPRMGGRELARKLAILGSTKVLFTSGDTEGALRRHGLVPGDGALLRKAFTPADLLRKVREVLDADADTEALSCG